MFPKYYPQKKHRGFLIPLSLVLLIGIAFLATAILRLTATSSYSSVSEGMSVQAFFAAESGAYYAMHRLFYSGGNRTSVDGHCRSISGSRLNFPAAGLQACSVDIFCSYSTDSANTTSYYLVNSAAHCGEGDTRSERVVKVSAFMQ